MPEQGLNSFLIKSLGQISYPTLSFCKYFCPYISGDSFLNLPFLFQIIKIDFVCELCSLINHLSLGIIHNFGRLDSL